MDIPSEFRHLVRCFHQDMLAFASTEEGLVAKALACLTLPQQRIVKAFLTRLLAENDQPQQLQAIWEDAGPDWSVSDEGIRRLLTTIRDAID